MDRLRRVCVFRIELLAAVLLALGSLLSAAPADASQVALAGFAYGGDHKSIPTRFPLTHRYDQRLMAAGSSLNDLFRRAVEGTTNPHFALVGQIDELKGRDTAVAVALVVNSETVSEEQIGKHYKVLSLVRGQVLFFDFKSQNVLRTYPIHFAYIDVLDRKPSESEKTELIARVYEGVKDKPGMFARFAEQLSRAALPSPASRLLQVSRVTVQPEAAAQIPPHLASVPGGFETWTADLFAEALSARTGIPLLPFSKGHAIGGVMPVRIGDSDVWNLKLPKPDYEITLELSALRKVPYGKSGAGESFIYGSFVRLGVTEPLLGKTIFNSALKNGEVKQVPATQVNVEDFPAYFDSLQALFVKFGDAAAGKASPWIKTAANAPDIESQLNALQKLLQSCK